MDVRDTKHHPNRIAARCRLESDFVVERSDDHRWSHPGLRTNRIKAIQRAELRVQHYPRVGTLLGIPRKFSVACIARKATNNTRMSIWLYTAALWTVRSRLDRGRSLQIVFEESKRQTQYKNTTKS